MTPDRSNAVLAHERHQVRVRYQVSGGHGVEMNLAVLLPETVALARSPDGREGEQLAMFSSASSCGRGCRKIDGCVVTRR